MSQAILLTRSSRRAGRMVAAMRSYSGATASTSAPASAVDQMIEYAMGQRKTNADMAVDVLMSGLSYSSPEADPVGSARLHLAIAQVEVDRNNWAKAQSHASSGMRAVAPRVVAGTPGAADATLLAGSLGVRAALIQGQDADGQALAAECERALRPTAPSSSGSAGPSAPHTRSLGLLSLSSLSSSSSSGAGAAGTDQLTSALGPDPGAAVRSDPALADAVHALGMLRALQGQGEAAETAFAAASEAAAAAAGAQAGDSKEHNHEVEADALTGRAQLQMRAKEWGAAEEILGSALKAAEAAQGDRSPSLAPLLTLLGYTYSRSARVTFAEGLFREAAKLLRLDPARMQPQQEQQQLQRTAAAAGVHTSAVAVLAWRYAQLLWVLPNRGGEAARWEGCARQYWAAGCSSEAARDIEAVLGGKTHLRGEGPEGSGVVMSTRFRRAWQSSQ